VTNPDASRFAGLRVLVVEDDFFVAKSLGLLLEALGCTLVGPASTSDEALELIKHEALDAAVLDITLSPGTSAPVARALLYRGYPFTFITGYSSVGMLPDDMRGYRVLHKPVDCETLCSALDEMARPARP
jgi:CheY-like chemotaxis protein